eukprot:6212640-Pleurochrysis_carterae.AAC.1
MAGMSETRAGVQRRFRNSRTQARPPPPRPRAVGMTWLATGGQRVERARGASLPYRVTRRHFPLVGRGCPCVLVGQRADGARRVSTRMLHPCTRAPQIVPRARYLRLSARGRFPPMLSAARAVARAHSFAYPCALSPRSAGRLCAARAARPRPHARRARRAA